MWYGSAGSAETWKRIVSPGATLVSDAYASIASSLTPTTPGRRTRACVLERDGVRLARRRRSVGCGRSGSTARRRQRPASTSEVRPRAAPGVMTATANARRPPNRRCLTPTGGDPAGFVQGRCAAAEEVVELAPVGDVCEQVEEIARVRSREARVALREPPLPARSEVDVREELRHVVRARPLADAVVRLLVGA